MPGDQLNLDFNQNPPESKKPKTGKKIFLGRAEKRRIEERLKIVREQEQTRELEQEKERRDHAPGNPWKE